MCAECACIAGRAKDEDKNPITDAHAKELADTMAAAAWKVE
jgi:hypothetical protein